MAEEPPRERVRRVDPRAEPESTDEPALPPPPENRRNLARTLRSALTPSAPTKRPAAVIEEVALPPDPSADELLGELELPLDDVAAPGQDDEAVTRVDGAAQTTSAKEDLFGIVGSLQAGTFRVQSVVARGGFGVIYAAYHQGFDAKVALKCLKTPAGLSPDQRESFLRKFEAEAQILFKLSSVVPEVVRPLHVGRLEADGSPVPFLVLEWLEGDSLKTILARRIKDGKDPIPLKRAVELLTPIARALSRAHAFPTPEGPVSIVHCDIKPDNLFMVRTEEGDMFKVLDFGIAKVRDAATRTAGGMTAADLQMFTPTYAAPEQWAPERFGQTGPWTDVHALALTLLEVAAQRPVYQGDPGRIVGDATNARVRPVPSTLGVASSLALDDVFRAALAVDPRDRTKTISEFWTALEAALGQSPSIAPPEPSDSAELSPETRKKSFFDFGALARTEPTSARSLEIPVSIDSKPLTPPAPPAQEEPAEPPRPALEVPAAPVSEEPVATKPSNEAKPTTAERLRVVGILAAASLALTLIGVIAGLAGIETYLQWVGATLLIVTVILVALKF